MKNAVLVILAIAAAFLVFSAIDFRVDDAKNKESVAKERRHGVMELCPVLSSPNTPQKTANECVRQAFGK